MATFFINVVFKTPLINGLPYRNPEAHYPGSSQGKGACGGTSGANHPTRAARDQGQL